MIYNALGHSIFENLKAFNLVFEGWRDKQLFFTARAGLTGKNKALKTKLLSIGACHAKGVKDIGRITPILELASRDWIVISDSDKAAVEQQKQYKGTGKWLRYDQLLNRNEELTGEDFIKATSFKNPLNEIRDRNPSLKDIALPTFDGSKPKIIVIKDWLNRNGITGEQLKVELDQLKESIFNSLKTSDIEDNYIEILNKIAEEIPSD